MTISFNPLASQPVRPIEGNQFEGNNNYKPNVTGHEVTEFEKKTNVLMKESLRSLTAQDGFSEQETTEMQNNFFEQQITKIQATNKASVTKMINKAKANREEDEEDEE